MRLLLAELLLLSALSVRSTSAQRIGGPPPTAAECDSAAASLTSGNRDAVAWSWLGRCGSVGGNALGAALLAARSEMDAEYLMALYGPTSVNRDPAILAAAAQVAADKAATASARITAILVLVGQMNDALAPSLTLSTSDLLGTPIGTTCPLMPTFPAGYVSRQPLQPDSLQLFAGTLDQIRQDAIDNQMVREWASCARNKLSLTIPIMVNHSLIRLSYVCGSRFRVENLSHEWIQVAYRVDHTDEKAGFTVGPGAERLFTTLGTGTVRLIYMGHGIATAANGGTPCP
jgi:hypothetical protein